MTSKPIRRPTPWGAVWLTYRTRPLVWLCSAGLMLSVALLTLDFNSPWHKGTSMRGALPQTPRPAPFTHVSIGADGQVADGRQLDWATLRSLTVYSGVERCQPLWTPGAMPKLESLTLYEQVGDHRIAKLCELYDLKALELPSASSLTTVAMEHLSNEPRLEFLSLAAVGSLRQPTTVPGMLPEAIEQERSRHTRLIHHAPEVAWPTGLKTLIYDDVGGATAARLNEWRRLPKLRCLATRLIPVKDSQLSDETLDALRHIPALRQLFLHEFPGEGAELASVQQHRLPNLIVRPFHYENRRVVRAGLIVLHALIVTALLAIQMSTQFVSPASLLTPHFARWHVGFVAGVSMVLAISSFAALRVAGCPASVALGLCGISVLMLALPAKLLRRSMGFPMPGFTNFALVMPSVIFPLLALQLVVNGFGSEFDWLLRGQHPWITWGLLAGAVWGAFDLVKWHFDLSRQLEEAGCANAPLGMFDMAGWTEWCRTNLAAREARGRKPPFTLRGRDAELDRFVESLYKRRETTALALWRQGNAQSTLKIVLFFVVFFIPTYALSMAAVSVATGSLDLARPWTDLKFLGPMAGQVLFMLLIFPFSFAWQRRPMLAVELLRPIDRRDWIRMWFRGIACELASVLLIAATFAAVAWSTGQLDNWSAVQLLVAAILLIGIVLVAAATLMSLITVDSIWWCLVPIGVFGGMIFVLVMANHDRGWTMSVQLTTICCVYTTAVVGLWIARWRWRNWEVGRIA